jgi:hypothetical protein
MRRGRERQQQAQANHFDNAFHARFPLIIKIAPDDKARK